MSYGFLTVGWIKRSESTFIFTNGYFGGFGLKALIHPTRIPSKFAEGAN